MQRAKYVFGTIAWGTLAHLLLSIAVPLAVLLFVRLELAALAVGIVLASKWRIIAVQPRHWLANFRTNSPDLIVNFSFVILLMRAETIATNLVLIGLYIIWLVWLKPQSREIYVGLQALVTHFIGLTALFWLADSLNEVLVVLAAWLIALSASRHFLSHFEEPLLRIISYTWALFVAQVIWLANRWLVIYPLSDDVVMPQAAVLVTLIGYILGTLYLLSQKGVLKRSITRNYVVLGCVIIGLVMYMTDWSVER